MEIIPLGHMDEVLKKSLLLKKPENLIKKPKKKGKRKKSFLFNKPSYISRSIISGNA